MANTMCKGNPKWGQNAMMENKDLSAKVMEWWLFKKMVVWIFFFVKKKKKLFLLSWFVDGGWGSDVP